MDETLFTYHRDGGGSRRAEKRIATAELADVVGSPAPGLSTAVDDTDVPLAQRDIEQGAEPGCHLARFPPRFIALTVDDRWRFTPTPGRADFVERAEPAAVAGTTGDEPEPMIAGHCRQGRSAGRVLPALGGAEGRKTTPGTGGGGNSEEWLLRDHGCGGQLYRAAELAPAPSSATGVEHAVVSVATCERPGSQWCDWSWCGNCPCGITGLRPSGRVTVRCGDGRSSGNRLEESDPQRTTADSWLRAHCSVPGFRLPFRRTESYRKSPALIAAGSSDFPPLTSTPLLNLQPMARRERLSPAAESKFAAGLWLLGLGTQPDLFCRGLIAH